MRRSLAGHLALVLLSTALVATGCGRDALLDPPASADAAKAPSTSGPSVNGTNPAGTAPGTTLDVRILGSGFESGTQASFALKGAAAGIVTNRTSWVSSRELVANITVASDADVALYDVVVVTPGGKKGIGTEMFEVAYIAYDLGVGGAKSEATAINEQGQVAGWVRERSGKQVAFVWQNGVVTKLPVEGWVTDINDRGWVLGHSSPRSWIWRPGSGVEWIAPPPGRSSFQGEAMNNDGMVVGSGGLIWTGTGFIDPLAGGTGAGFDINVDGVMVGSSSAGSFRYTPGVGVEYLGTSGGEALALNDLGQVAGWHRAQGSSMLSAYLWTDGTAIQVAVPGPNGSVALGVSNAGMVVGRNGDLKAFRWTAEEGAIQLGSVRTPPASSQANDVNDLGWIVGRSNDRATLWRP